MISNKSKGITETKWSNSGKIASINSNRTKILAYLYEASGQMVMKQLVNCSTISCYIRDASGNIKSSYSESAGSL
jgi:hypothetical protein